MVIAGKALRHVALGRIVQHVHGRFGHRLQGVARDLVELDHWQVDVMVGKVERDQGAEGVGAVMTSLQYWELVPGLIEAHRCNGLRVYIHR